jgi:hypothetical protein
MTTRELDDLMREAAALTDDEKLRLAAALIEQARQGKMSTVSSVMWRDLRARLKAPALGEEAQAWVTRTRQESAGREPR